MAKRRKEKDKKKEEKEKNKNVSGLNFKHWVSRTIMIAGILLVFIYILEVYTGNELLVNTLIAMLIVLCFGFTHEALHYYEAIKLGYKPEWYRTKIKMGFTIEHEKAGKWAKDKKKIARLPYIVIVPASIFVLMLGIYYYHLGLMVAGACSLLLHAVSWPAEGKEE